jgi:chromosome segregation ATPase
VPDDDVEARVTSLEHEVVRLRQQITLISSDAAVGRADAAAARLLAAGADRDVSEIRTELRAHTQVLNALRETQLEQSREMREGFASQGRRIDGLEQRFDGLEQEMRTGFATMAAGMAQITELLADTKGSEHDG